MDSQSKSAFLILILLQGLHCIEEYLGHHWEEFPSEDQVTSILSESQETSFLFLNLGFFFFGLWCWWIPVRGDYGLARALVCFWIVVELLNGLGHSIWAIYERDYVPGIITSPLLLVLALFLAGKLMTSKIN